MAYKIKVSVLMPVYNHELYIGQAIESVLAQKVNFQYELLIGEDCSTDHSLEIIKKYADEHPDIIKLFAREKNMGGTPNAYDLANRASGEYVICLEGDDYWSSNEKLQKQVDFLDNHPKYIACGHRFHVVNQHNETYYDKDFECQFFQNNPYTKEIVEQGKLLSHINTMMYRNIYKDPNIDTTFMIKFPNTAGDYTMMAFLILHGKIYCLPEYMSCYRKVVNAAASSFSSQQEFNNKRDMLFQDAMELERFLDYQIDCTARKKAIFASAVFKWYRSKNKKDFAVVRHIIKKSGKSWTYTKWFCYLVTCRFLLNILGKKNKRVKF